MHSLQQQQQPQQQQQTKMPVRCRHCRCGRLFGFWTTTLCLSLFFFFLSLMIQSVTGQAAHEYDDNDYYGQQQQQQQPPYDDVGYGQEGGGGEDSLYADYAARQDAKYGDTATATTGGGYGMGTIVGMSLASWFCAAKFHTHRAVRKIKTKFQKEQKELYAQYYNDVYKLTETNQQMQELILELQDALRGVKDKHEMEQIQRDYDEFKQPDVDGDDRISRAEFNMYVKNYLSHYPGLNQDDYPKFEDFDHDNDGFVSFKEYAQQMALQAQKAEQDQLYGDGGSSGGQKAQAYKDMARGMYG